MTKDEIEAIFADGIKEIKKAKERGDELSEEQLDDVAGGGFWRGIARGGVSAVAAFGYGALCGGCPAAAGGYYYVGVGLSAWTAAGFMK